MADFNLNVFGDVSGYMSAFRNVMIVILVSVVVIGVVGFFVWRRLNNKRYNIPLVIITPRSDGRVVEVNYGWGGYFKSKRVGGITSFRIKRKGIGIVDIPPPLSSYLSSPDRTLFLAQKGVDDYEPIMPDQLAFVDTADGRQGVPLLKLKAVNQDATAWAFDNAETAKKRFTFFGLWDKYKELITMMIFVFILFLILYINWIGMKDVVAALKELVEAIRGTGGAAPVISQGG